MGLADMGYSPVSLGDLEHPLMLTDEVRSLLAVIAPWLSQQQPFLLVGSTERRSERFSVQPSEAWQTWNVPYSAQLEQPAGYQTDPSTMPHNTTTVLTLTRCQQCSKAQPHPATSDIQASADCSGCAGSRLFRLRLSHLLSSNMPVLAAVQVGPEGCGKSTVLDYCFSRLPGKVTVARVHCSAQTTADTVIQKLLQVGWGWSVCGVVLRRCEALAQHPNEETEPWTRSMYTMRVSMHARALTRTLCVGLPCRCAASL